MVERLPGQHDGAILGAIEEGPVHGLRLAHDLLGGQEVFDDGIGWEHVDQRIAMTGDQVHVRELRRSV